MVKKTHIKYLLKAIQKNGVSFFAVALIAATSIAIYLGIQSGAVTILQYTDQCFRENHLATMEIACANGITQDDVDALSAHPRVQKAEGGYQTTAIMDSKKEKMNIQVRSLLQELNQPVVLEGELPKAADEVAIEEKMAIKEKLKVGDQLFIEKNDALYNQQFRITAIINEPSFSCIDVQDARGRAEAGFGSCAYYIEVAEEAFDTAYYQDCYTTVYTFSEELSNLDFYSDEYTTVEASLKKELETFGNERSTQRYDSLVNTAKETIDQIEQQIAQAEAAYQSAADALLAVGGDPEGDPTLTLKYKELTQMKGLLEKVKPSVDEVSKEDWILSGRNSMGDVSGIEIIVEGLFTLSYSFALIFLLVAVIVCYAAVVKMIDDQKMLIGAQKALGIKSIEIFAHYLSYNIFSALLGILIGWLASVFIVENLVLYVFGAEFSYHGIPLTFVWKEAAIVALLCLVIFVAASCAGCVKVVRQPAVDLLRGEMPTRKKPYFFESWKLYQKMNLYSRTMIKNVLSDKGRILTTIMGVVGCISLLIITFTLKFSISNATDVQFKKYFLYENRLAVDTQEGDIEEYQQLLEEENISFVRIQDKLENFRPEGEEWMTMHVIALNSDNQIKNYIKLEDVETGEDMKLPKEGVLVSRKCAENYDLKEGSVFQVMDSSGNAKECKVAGVMEHYLPYHQMVTSVEYYEQIFGKQADECIFLLKGDIKNLYNIVKEMSGFMSLRDNSEYKDPFTSINLVIAICVFFSALLAVLVLLNQMTMYINRKAKELSVMRINGYTIKETKRFIGRDNVFLVAIGLLVGCVVGTPLAQFEVIIMETGTSRYIRTPNLTACLLSAMACICFALIINKIALRRIHHLSLTNVNGN